MRSQVTAAGIAINAKPRADEQRLRAKASEDTLDRLLALTETLVALEPPSLPSCPAQRSLRRSEPSQPLSSADGAVSPRSNAHTHEIKPVNWKWRQRRCEMTLRAMVRDILLYGVWQIS
jgi:hypothetical protein